MRRRAGFTLIEMMVSVALVLFIMVILTEAFGKGLESFRTLKALGDMETRMRSTAALVRRDLGMNHFEGQRKLSDPKETWNLTGPPREGFIHLKHLTTAIPTLTAQDEGNDADGLPARRRTNHILHFAVRAKGNNRSEFFTASVPPPAFGKPSLIGGNGSNLVRTTFFDHPADARFQDTNATYSSQWAEVAYFFPRDRVTGMLQPSGTTADGIPLYTLYRSQYVMVADNSLVNWNPRNPSQSVFQILPGSPNYEEMCCVRLPDQAASTGFYRLNFSTPSDVAQNPLARAFNDGIANPLHGAKPLLTDVVSFDFQVDRGNGWADLTNLSPSGQSGGDVDSNLRGNLPVQAIKISLRVYDPKTKLSRQMTIIQDL